MKRTLIALAAALAALCSQAAGRKPNFLFIYTDDQRYDALGVVQREQGAKGRYPWFKTPSLDRIANEGARFRNAFVTLSLCAPSRAAFLTGQYNHHNGIAGNRTFFPETNVTHASLLTAAGYKTAYIGKWHMGGQRGQRPGFSYSASFIGQGRYLDCAFEINGNETPTKGWVDDVSTDYAIEFIKQNRDNPFSVVVGFKSCHGPTTPPERAKERFEGVRARRVPNLGVRAVYLPGEALGQTLTASNEEGSTVPVNINYFRCLSAMDDNVGRLLQALDEFKLAEDTVVVFASDNGYYHGEHGLSDKRSGYEESLRIPFLVRYPKLIRNPMVLDQMVLNIDLAPTLLDLAGITVPQHMQGRSWRPLLSAQEGQWRKSFLFEYFRENAFPGTPALVGVRTETAKLVKYPGHDEWTELFDLISDPYELKNLVKDASSKELMAKMQKEFELQSTAVGFRIPEYAHRNDPGATPGAGRKRPGKKGKSRTAGAAVSSAAAAGRASGEGPASLHEAAGKTPLAYGTSLAR